VSTMSRLDFEQSDGLAKRFADLASAYFAEPGEAKTEAAKIPLENLFRMLQMFRYDAFSDEPRSGILELEGFSDQNRAIKGEEFWHQRIQAAISTAVAEVFGATPRDEAVSQIQSALTWLATDKDPPPVDVRQRSRHFLERFRAALG
jgi:hypothetical protein